MNTCQLCLLFLDHSFTCVNEEIDYEAKDQCRVSRNGHNRCVTSVFELIRKTRSNSHHSSSASLFSNTDVQKDSGRSRVPVVCLERLKILVSQLPPHGRRQSDPLPASGTERSEILPQQRTWHEVCLIVSRKQLFQ